MYTQQRFSRYAVKTLDIRGFDTLALPLQQVVYHLTLAGQACRDVITQQYGPYGRAVLSTLTKLCLLETLSEDAKLKLQTTLNVVMVCNGIYHDMQGDRIVPDFNSDEFAQWAQMAGIENDHDYISAQKGLFSPDVPSSQSESFTWAQGVSNDVRQAYIDQQLQMFASRGENSPMVGLNLVLVPGDTPGSVREQRYAVGQIFSEELSESCHHLANAAACAEDYPLLQDSINTLIKFYQTGDPVDFDRHCLAWLKNKDCPIYFSQGFIERLDDPIKQLCSYQSLVGFKDPHATEQMQRILDLSQYIEDTLPFDSAFKRTKATGIMGAAIRVVSMEGVCSPILPLGNVLPNNKWIREQHGSFSALFLNVAEKRGILTDDMRQRFIAPAHIDALSRYHQLGFQTAVSLHECAGHASGRMLEGVSVNALGSVYGIIEECRADLVAYYLLGDANFIGQILPEVKDHDSFAKAMYAEYLTQGTLHQLFRLSADSRDYGAATHLRNRQLNNAYVLERALRSGAVKEVQTPYGVCLEVISLSSVQSLYGELLAEIQRIKSTGDKQAAESLVEQYGTYIDPNQIKDAHQRVADLSPASYFAFEKPELPTFD